MKNAALILLLLSTSAFAEGSWRRVELGGMVIEIPVLENGSADPSRLQRRIDGERTPPPLTPNTNPLWPLTGSWTEALEAEYSAWVKREVDESFFRGSGVKVDCADAAIAFRWIFSREKGLPAAQTLAGSGRLFGSWGSTDEWDQLPSHPDWRRDERFKAALRYLLNNIYTHSIRDDLYPIEITPNHLVPGTVYLTLFGSSGHTRTLMKVANRFLELIYGNEPPAEELWLEQTVPYWIPEREGGFMRPRWPEPAGGQWILRAKNQMPGYSTEQYDWGEYDFSMKFNDRMQLWNSLHEQISTAATQLVRDLKTRVTVVERGYYICALVPCAPGSPEDSKYSTPQRDHRLAEAAGQLENLLGRLSPGDWLLQDLRAKNGIPVMAGGSLTYWDLFSKAAVLKLSSDPTQSLFPRWGGVDTADANAARARGEAFFHNWTWREDLVGQAQQLCYPNGAVQPQCDPFGKEAVALNTARLDQAFRLERAALAGLIGRLPAAERTALQAEFSRQLTRLQDCAGACSAWDLLHSPHIDRMTSGAADPAGGRYGVP